MIAKLALPPALEWKLFNLACHFLGTSLMPSTLVNWMQTELSCIFKIHLGSFFPETSCYFIWGFKYPISIYFLSKFGFSCILFLPSGHNRSKQVENILIIKGRFPIGAKNLLKYSQFRKGKMAQVTTQFTASKHKSDACESLEFNVQPLWSFPAWQHHTSLPVIVYM